MEKNLPKITVITCTYMKFQSIYKTIDSVLSQDYPFFEYIICDDGSDNFPEESIDAYIRNNKKKNIVEYKLIHLPENLGTVKNLNNGFKNSTGKYVFSVSAGDAFYDRNTVKKVIKTMEENCSDFFCGTRLAVSEEGIPQYFLPSKIYSKYLSSISQGKQYSMFVSGQFYAMFSGSAMAIKRDFYERAGRFDERYLLWEDGPFIEKALRIGKVTTRYDLVTVKYELGGISSGNTNQKLNKDLELYNRSDRISHLEMLSKFYKTLLRVNIDNNKHGIVDLLKHPVVFLYKIKYRIQYKLGLALDRYFIIKMR